MTIEELVAAVQNLVGDRYFSVERNMRSRNGRTTEHWAIAVELGKGTPLLIVGEVNGPKHDDSSPVATFETLKQILTLPTTAPSSTEAA